MTKQESATGKLKLFMVLLGSKAPGRHVEQHDFFFGIGTSLKELIPAIKSFWPEAGDKIHIDGWREVTAVEDYQINIVNRGKNKIEGIAKKLFFINLGGYQATKFEEQHYVILTVKEDRAKAAQKAKNTLFFKHNHFKGANSHIDDSYGIDVDDLYEIHDILPPAQKEKYQIEITAAIGVTEDPLQLGYLTLNKLSD